MPVAPGEKRVRRAEERLDRQRKEANELREEFAKVKALAAKISELSEKFDKFRANQDRLNQAVSQEITDLRTRLDGEVSPTLRVHVRELAGLSARYAALHSLATGLFTGTQQTAMGRFPVNPIVQPPGYTTYATGPQPMGASYYRPNPTAATETNAPQIPLIRKTIAV